MRIFLALLFFLVAGAAGATERPVVAVLGDSVSTEITDFMLPYGVLQRAGGLHVLAVAVDANAPITMNTGLRVQPDIDTQAFDQRFPKGADYVIVPAMRRSAHAPLLAWLQAQAAKGATLVSICDGALVLANSGVLKGRRATAHWATHGMRVEKYPDTQWLANLRYVTDGKVISSAGISAALPVSLALLETIAGRDRAAAVAAELGVSDWSDRHDSGIYAPQFGRNLGIWITHYTDQWFHSAQPVGLPLADGIDEIALAYASDAYTRTHRSRVLAVAPNGAPQASRFGLKILPDRVAGSADAPATTLPSLPGTLDQVLAQVGATFGERTAHRIALEFEYAGYRAK
jgi:putative intracellular protease/amidase